jgi:isoquinoline 1-oxidoreductase beta subunit
MTLQPTLDRRQFFFGAAAGALIIGLHLPARVAAETPAASDGVALNTWLRIGADDSVTVIVGQVEMGQGIYTALPMLVAEELECDWSKVKVEAAPAGDAFKNLYAVKEALSGGHADELTGSKDWLVTKLAGILGEQFTGGSSSVRGGYVPLRQAGATAREMLRAAAAKEWSVPIAECTAKAGQILHAKSGKSATYGKLAAAAAKLDPPDNVALKPKSAWKLLGTPVVRLDLADKVTGRAQFGIDVRLPGMLFASVRNCPVFGGKWASHDAAAVLKMPA